MFELLCRRRISKYLQNKLCRPMQTNACKSRHKPEMDYMSMNKLMRLVYFLPRQKDQGRFTSSKPTTLTILFVLHCIICMYQNTTQNSQFASQRFKIFYSKLLNTTCILHTCTHNKYVCLQCAICSFLFCYETMSNRLEFCRAVF